MRQRSTPAKMLAGVLLKIILKNRYKMQELQLKHIAPHFPYGLKMTFRVGGKVGVLRAIYNYEQETHPVRLLLDGMDSEHIWMFKPILKPIQELDELHAQKLTEFIGKDWCEAYDEYFEAWINDLANTDKLVLQAPQPIFNYFLSQHFDVFGLIDKGLATSVDDIK